VQACVLPGEHWQVPVGTQLWYWPAVHASFPGHPYVAVHDLAAVQQLLPGHAQVTVTDVTLPLPTVPVPELTVQTMPWPGCVWTLTAYMSPLGTGVLKVKVLFELSDRLLLPLSWSTTGFGPNSPVSVPPTMNVVVVHVISTEVTFAAPTVPESMVTTHVCTGSIGLPATVTAYAVPVASGVGNEKEPFVVMKVWSPPLSFTTTVAPPARPTTIPPMVKVSDAQLTTTVVTAAALTVPLAALTEHVWPGACVFTVTA
jgi:hypothetical protein